MAGEAKWLSGARRFWFSSHRFSLLVSLPKTLRPLKRSNLLRLNQPSVAEVETPKRNFILITADTMRGDVASIDGGPAYTPTLVKMRERSWHFRRCYSTSMLTNPSHASIMTSLYSQDHGVYDNSSGIDASHKTLAESFAEAGYETHAVIAFKHLDPHVSRLGQGFSSVSPAPEQEPDALASVERALSWLKSRPDQTKPFFMWLHIVDPHAPYESTALDEERKPLTKVYPMKTAKRTAPSFQRKHPWYKSVFERYKTTELMQSRYITEVELVDRGLELLLDGLKGLKLDETTGVVFTSDHGENLGERELFSIMAGSTIRRFMYRFSSIYRGSPVHLRVRHSSRRLISRQLSWLSQS